MRGRLIPQLLLLWCLPLPPQLESLPLCNSALAHFPNAHNHPEIKFTTKNSIQVSLSLAKTTQLSHHLLPYRLHQQETKILLGKQGLTASPLIREAESPINISATMVPNAHHRMYFKYLYCLSYLTDTNLLLNTYIALVI